MTQERVSSRFPAVSGWLRWCLGGLDRADPLRTEPRNPVSRAGTEDGPVRLGRCPRARSKMGTACDSYPKHRRGISPEVYARTVYYESNTMSNKSETRDVILDCVDENPGIHFNELVRSISPATGQVQYHIRRLIDSNEVDRMSLYGRTHYYPAEYPEGDRGAVALLRRETARGIVVYVIENGESHPEEVADGLGIARSTLEWHLGRLEEQGLVEKARGDGSRVCVEAVGEERTVEMLSDISPSLPDRLVDRFMNMVDRMLEEPGGE